MEAMGVEEDDDTDDGSMESMASRGRLEEDDEIETPVSRQLYQYTELDGRH